jgi:hypothetical protein
MALKPGAAYALLIIEAGAEHSQSPAIACGVQGDENSLRPGSLIRRSILLALFVIWQTDGCGRKSLGSPPRLKTEGQIDVDLAVQDQ